VLIEKVGREGGREGEGEGRTDGRSKKEYSAGPKIIEISYRLSFGRSIMRMLSSRLNPPSLPPSLPRTGAPSDTNFACGITGGQGQTWRVRPFSSSVWMGSGS